jgi:hypothetical protein
MSVASYFLNNIYLKPTNTLNLVLKGVFYKKYYVCVDKLKKLKFINSLRLFDNAEWDEEFDSTEILVLILNSFIS